MSATVWLIIAIISFSLAGVAFIVAVFMFIKMNIPAIIGDLTGRTVAKEVKAMKAAHMSVGNRSYSKANIVSNPRKSFIKYNNITDPVKTELPYKQMNSKYQEESNTQLPNKPVEMSSVMNTDRLATVKDNLDVDVGTTVLNNNKVIKNAYSTTVLSNQGNQNAYSTTVLSNQGNQNNYSTTVLSNQSNQNTYSTTVLDERIAHNRTTLLNEQSNLNQALNAEAVEEKNVYSTTILNSNAQIGGTTVLKDRQMENKYYENNIGFEVTRSILLINSDEEI